MIHVIALCIFVVIYITGLIIFQRKHENTRQEMREEFKKVTGRYPKN